MEEVLCGVDGLGEGVLLVCVCGDSEEGCWVKTRKISTARPMTPQMRVMRELVFLERAVFIGLGMGFSL